MAELIQAGSDKELQYFLMICHKEEQQQAMDAIKPFSASTVSFKDVAGTAKENMAAIDRELEELSKRREELAREIATYGDQRKSLQISLDRLNQEVAKETVREKMLTDGTVVFLEGWAAGTKLEELQKELGRFTWRL